MTLSRVFVLGACAFGLSAVGGCSSSASGGSPPPSVATDAGNLADGGSAAEASTATTPEAGGLPFVVDSVYVTSGYFGDHSDVTMTPTSATDTKDCDGDPAPSTAGNCHIATYTPDPASDTSHFAGIYWQYPANNFGAMPGFNIPAGATQVTFWAKGAAGGEQVAFFVGGLKAAGAAHGDAWQAPAVTAGGAPPPTTLTSTWASYTIDVRGQPYTPADGDGVLGGFAWVASYNPEGGAPSVLKFYVDDIEWQ